MSPRTILRRYLGDRESITKSRAAGWLGARLHDSEVWHLGRRSVAGGVSLGFFLAFIPLPIQMLVAAPLAILLMVFVGYQVGQLMGWSSVSSLFLGAILSIASTSVIVKVLREMKRDREPFAGLIYGILIVEDLLGVVMIVLLTGIASTGDLGLQSMAASTGKLLVFLVTVLVVGLLVVPRLLNFVARFESNERLLVAVLGLCFGTSLVAAKLKDVARYHQVFVVTHLPQLASRARSHLLVEKNEGEGLAATAVKGLTGDARVREIARMLGGDPESETSQEHARELLAAAD